MPWRGPQEEGEYPTLGYEVLEWVADFLPSPRDPSAEFEFTKEQARLILRWFAIDPGTGRFTYRRGQLRRAKGWGKSPLLAALGIAELAGPVRFDGWDADGEPVGRPWGVGGDASAWVQIAAVSEDQTENTHSVIYELLTSNDGRAADELHIDAGLTRSYLRDGDRRGKLEPVTASAGSREGQPITFAIPDETHLWTPSNGGVRLMATIRRNLGKMNGRSLETTNSFVPGEKTVAEGTHKASEKGAPGLLIDAVEAPPISPDDDDPTLKDALKVAYGDAWWVDLDRIVQEVRDPDTEWDDACRFYLNWNRSRADGFLNIAAFEALATPDRILEPGEYVALGFDGSISQDSTVLYGCTPDGFVFELAAWERPKGADVGWRVPRLEVHQAVADAFDQYTVGRMFCDPPKWDTEIAQWVELYGEGTDDKPVVQALDTNKASRFAPACRRFETAVLEGSLTHDGKEGLTANLAACARKKVRVNDDDEDGRTMFVIVKADTRKIDRAVGAVLAFEAAMTMPEAAEVPTWFGGYA